MKTQGEIEASVCDGISRFEQEYMGRGPKDIRAHLIGDLLVVRLQGVLTAAEQHLVKTLPAEKGRDLLKQVRSQLIEVARPALEALIQDITGIKPLSLHHDISTITGEEVVIFTLAEVPHFRKNDTSNEEVPFISSCGLLGWSGRVVGEIASGRVLETDRDQMSLSRDLEVVPRFRGSPRLR